MATMIYPIAPSSICPECDFESFTRNHYFNGKLLVERDFNDEQRYYMEKMRHHNQRLHGWGVVCGLKVVPHPNEACRDRFVVVEPGTAIDCCGHEIVVVEPEMVELSQLPAIQELIEKQKLGDKEPHDVQICLRFKECPTEEIPVLYDECGCDATRCAPNRILESFEVGAILGPKREPPTIRVPQMKRKHGIPLRHATHVFEHLATNSLYIAATDSQTVFKIAIQTTAVLATYQPAGRVLAMAVSQDGKLLYVAIDDLNCENRKLVIFDATTTSSPIEPLVNTQIPDSQDSDVYLALTPDDRPCTMLARSRKLQLWPQELDEKDYRPSNTWSLGTQDGSGGDLRGLAISSDGSVAVLADPTNECIWARFLDEDGNQDGWEPIAAIGGVTDLVIVPSEDDDLLAVLVDCLPAKPRLLLIQSNDEIRYFPALLEHKPIALAVSPNGLWAYVLEQDVSSNRSYVQAVSLHRLRLELEPSVSDPFLVGDLSQQIVISQGGDRLYVPFLQSLSQSDLGGVAVIEVVERACQDIAWQHLDGCPECDAPECVVLATIVDYKPGFRIDAQRADQNDKEIALIDNRRGRRLLPSTQAMWHTIKCLMEQGAGGVPGPEGPAGPQGPQGPAGDPGPDLNLDLPHIIAINWEHEGHYSNPDGAELLLVRGLIIAFDKPVKAETITPNTIQLLVRRQDEGSPYYQYWNVEGQVQAIDVLTMSSPEGLQLLSKCEEVVSEVKEVDTDGLAHGAWFSVKNEFAKVLENTDFKVLIEGNFILGAGSITLPNEKVVNPALDANHLGPGLPKRCPTGNGTEGGQFISWFTVNPPEVHVNTNSAETMLAAPHFSEAFVKRILTARGEGRFTSVEDFRTRTRPPLRLWSRIRPMIVIETE